MSNQALSFQVGIYSGSIDRALWMNSIGKSYYTQNDAGFQTYPRTSVLSDWTLLELRLDGGTSVEFIENGAHKITMTANAPNTNVGQRFEVLYTVSCMSIDWTFTRKWISWEPCNLGWGLEEVL